MKNKTTVALLCGGPSAERGISLNSARSVCDHLLDSRWEIVPIYFRNADEAFAIPCSHLYSNTPSDFDFKLQEKECLSREKLTKLLQQVDIVFPVIHGTFGEDGQIQKLLEDIGCPFVGSTASACQQLFDKHKASEFLKANNFYTIKNILLEKEQNNLSDLEKHFQDGDQIVVKPARSGSSIGVSIHTSLELAKHSIEQLWQQVDSRVVVEPFCQGKEFTVIVMENAQREIVALMPTEIAFTSDEEHFFDYRHKYLATNQINYHCPPHFSTETIAKIRQQAQEIFRLFNMNDFARFDGWLLDNGEIFFSDLNPVSGMEQNSFFFIQASHVGMSHHDVLQLILENSCRRQKVMFPPMTKEHAESKESVNVIFGGDSAERHVSLMSGTNVWLKLHQSRRYHPTPFLLDIENNVWKVPYPLCLYHTVEEIADLCQHALENEEHHRTQREEIQQQLGLTKEQTSIREFLPTKLSLEEFCQNSPKVFLALHGGIGENGELQAKLQSYQTPFTGSPATAAKLCMDKYQTGEILSGLENLGIFVAPKKVMAWQEFNQEEQSQLWQEITTKWETSQIIIKPLDEGCSAGVACLANEADLQIYLDHLRKGSDRILAGVMSQQAGIIEMPPKAPSKLLLEKYIETKDVEVLQKKLQVSGSSPWIEFTVGVLGNHNKMKAMSPSLTVAGAAILTLEEKFQGGTGTNITPPPPEIISPDALRLVQARIEIVAQRLGLAGFARIDTFVHTETGEIMIIEANTTPGLTPSTVIFHQALAEEQEMYPKDFLSRILEMAD